MAERAWQRRSGHCGRLHAYLMAQGLFGTAAVVEGLTAVTCNGRQASRRISGIECCMHSAQPAKPLMIMRCRQVPINLACRYLRSGLATVMQLSIQLWQIPERSLLLVAGRMGQALTSISSHPRQPVRRFSRTRLVRSPWHSFALLHRQRIAHHGE